MPELPQHPHTHAVLQCTTLCPAEIPDSGIQTPTCGDWVSTLQTGKLRQMGQMVGQGDWGAYCDGHQCLG